MFTDNIEKSDKVVEPAGPRYFGGSCNRLIKFSSRNVKPAKTVEDLILISRSTFLFSVIEKVVHKYSSQLLKDEILPLLFVYPFLFCSFFFLFFILLC